MEIELEKNIMIQNDIYTLCTDGNQEYLKRYDPKDKMTIRLFFNKIDNRADNLVEDILNVINQELNIS